jgi:IS30 family transposase
MKEKAPYQQLQPEERMTIASMKQQGSSVRAMARTLGRSASTVSRELARNTCSTVGYASAAAQAISTSRREAARPCPKLHPQSVSWRVVLTLLEWRWSPQQI